MAKDSQAMGQSRFSTQHGTGGIIAIEVNTTLSAKP